MRLANAWGPAFAFALVVHITALALAGQGLQGEIALEPKTEYMEVELAPAAPPPSSAREQLQTQNMPVTVASQGKNLINGNRINTASMPASSGFTAVGDQTSALPGVATVSEGGQVMSINGSAFGTTAGSREAGNGGEASEAAPAPPPRVEQEIDRQASINYKAPPEYPSEARKNHWQGVVWVSVLIEASGNVADVRVAETSGYDALDQAAKNVVFNRWRFNPAYRNGQPVPSRVKVPVSFSLD